MTKKILCLIIGFAVGLVACASRHFPNYYFDGPALGLASVEEDWNAAGRPANFDLYKETSQTNVFFVYTNTVTKSNIIYHCVFGARYSWWPPGVLAITDSGNELWIREPDGDVTLLPVANGIELDKPMYFPLR